jgi:hypothetical protein
MRILLPKRWSRARRKSARAVIRYDVARMQALDRYAAAMFELRAKAFETFSQEMAETFLGVATGASPP